MKVTKKQLLTIINEVLDAKEDFNLSQPAQRILPLLVNLKKIQSNPYIKNIETFLSKASLLIGLDYDSLEMTLKIGDKTAGYVSYKIITREYRKSGTYCRPSPYEDRSTFMLDMISRSESFKGYGIGRLLGFLSVCYINANNGTVTSDRNTSDLAGKELIDSLKMIGANKSESFDYVGWLLGSIHRVFYKDRAFNTEPLTYHYDSVANSSKTGTKGKRESRKLEIVYNEEMEALIRKFLTKHKPMTQSLTDDCYPSVNITFGEKEISLMNIYNHESFKDFLEKGINMTSEELQNLLDSDERVQGYTFTLNEMMINAGTNIIDVINKTGEYELDEFQKEFDKAHDMFQDVYTKNVTEPGVGYRNIDDIQGDV